jgi:hypothetical protein
VRRDARPAIPSGLPLATASTSLAVPCWAAEPRGELHAFAEVFMTLPSSCTTGPTC